MKQNLAQQWKAMLISFNSCYTLSKMSWGHEYNKCVHNKEIRKRQTITWFARKIMFISCVFVFAVNILSVVLWCLWSLQRRWNESWWTSAARTPRDCEIWNEGFKSCRYVIQSRARYKTNVTILFLYTVLQVTLVLHQALHMLGDLYTAYISRSFTDIRINKGWLYYTLCLNDMITRMRFVFNWMCFVGSSWPEDEGYELGQRDGTLAETGDRGMYFNLLPFLYFPFARVIRFLYLLSQIVKW